MHQSAIIEDLAIILCIAGFVTVLFQKIKQPTVLGYLLAGIIIGPYTPPFSLIDDQKDIKILAELGVIFLMFSLGLEFSCRKLTRVGISAVIIGIFEVVMMILIGYLSGVFLGWSVYESLLLGAALSISSTTIIIKALEDFSLKKQFFAELMIGVLLVEDLLAILLMVFISTTMTQATLFSSFVFWATIKLLGVIASWFLVGYFVIPYLMRKIENDINHETLTIVSTGLCLFLSSIAVHFNYSAALGGFIMGSILAETSQVQKIETLTLPIRDIFGAVFFVSVGMLIDPEMIIKYFPYVILLSLVTIFGKIVTSAIGTLLAGHNFSTALRIGFSMAQIGEFSFIIIGLGGMMSDVGSALYPIVVAIAAITTFSTPYLIKFSLKFSENAETYLPNSIEKGLKVYKSWMQHLHMNQSLLKGKDFFRIVVNAIIVAIICSISFSFIRPHIDFFNQHFTIMAILTLILASPFFVGMSSASKSPLIIGLSICIVTAELLFFVMNRVPDISSAVTIFLTFILFIIFFYSYLVPIYFWMENQLINNLTKRRSRELLPKWRPWDYELVRFKVDKKFPFAGKRVEECPLKPSYGINIIAIKRGKKTIWLPHLTEEILEHDELVIYGDSDEIDHYSNYMEKIEN